jgi:hypothetical protein
VRESAERVSEWVGGWVSEWEWVSVSVRELTTLCLFD